MSDEMVNNQEQTVADNATVETVSTTTSFLDNLNEDLRTNESLQDFKDVNSLAKSYVEQKRMLGNSIRIPSSDAGEEQFNEFYSKLEQVPGVMRTPNLDDEAAREQFFNKLGRPETVDGYQLELPEDQQIDMDQANAFLNIAHKIGLTKDQVNALTGFEIERMNQYNEYITQSRVSGEETLRQEWGNSFDERLAGAKAARNYFAQKYPEAIQELTDGTVGNNPALIAMLSELGQVLGEKGITNESASNAYGLTPSEALAQIQDITNNSSHAYHNPSDLEHKAAVEKMQQLYAIAYPE